MITCDGHPALLRALRGLFPAVPVQISVAHRLLMLSRALPPQIRGKCLAEARAIFGAPDRETAVLRFREWQTRWRQQGITAIRALETDLASCLTFYRFPPHLWPRIRTVNLVERLSREARRAADLPEMQTAATADFGPTPSMEALPWQMDFRALVARLTGERPALSGVFPRSTTPPQVHVPDEPSPSEGPGADQLMTAAGRPEPEGDASPLEARALEMPGAEPPALAPPAMQAPAAETWAAEAPATGVPLHSVPPLYMEETRAVGETSGDGRPPAATSESLMDPEPVSAEWPASPLPAGEGTEAGSVPRAPHARAVAAATALAGLAAGVLASLLR